VILRSLAALSIAALCTIGTAAAAQIELATPAQRLSDLHWLTAKFEEEYAYRESRHLDWKRVAQSHRDAAMQAGDIAAWIGVLEKVVAELYDHHASLGANTQKSPQLIPSGTDIWAEMIAGSPTIVQVRPSSIASRAGLRPGMTVRDVAGEPVGVAMKRWRPSALLQPDIEAESFALRVLLAGNHVDRRRFVACAAGNRCQHFDLAPVSAQNADARVTWRTIDDALGYIRIENSLGDTGTIGEFDHALDALKNASGIILDLRNTPSGGNTDTAEPILGRFVSKPHAYQRVFEPGAGRTYPRHAWEKQVAPRAPLVRQPLVVLVDHWTGSMGEGMAIGLHAIRNAPIVGTKMAGLLGGTSEFELPNTHVRIRFPTERLYHVDGTPREAFVPSIVVDIAAIGDDTILAAGIEQLMRELASTAP
jgi:C-terminal processing protease CtpA/Prc